MEKNCRIYEDEYAEDKLFILFLIPDETDILNNNDQGGNDQYLIFIRGKADPNPPIKNV